MNAYDAFPDKFDRASNRNVQSGKDLVDLMSVYHWPGNVRELQNCIERLVVLAETSLIDVSSIPESLAPYFDHMRTVHFQSTPKTSRPVSQQTFPARLDPIERDHLREALRKAGWVKAKAARLSGMTPRQIAYRIEKYRLVEDA